MAKKPLTTGQTKRYLMTVVRGSPRERAVRAQGCLFVGEQAHGFI